MHDLASESSRAKPSHTCDIATPWAESSNARRGARKPVLVAVTPNPPASHQIAIDWPARLHALCLGRTQRPQLRTSK